MIHIDHYITGIPEWKGLVLFSKLLKKYRKLVVKIKHFKM